MVEPQLKIPQCGGGEGGGGVLQGGGLGGIGCDSVIEPLPRILQ